MRRKLVLENWKSQVEALGSFPSPRQILCKPRSIPSDVLLQNPVCFCMSLRILDASLFLYEHHIAASSRIRSSTHHHLFNAPDKGILQMIWNFKVHHYLYCLCPTVVCSRPSSRLHHHCRDALEAVGNLAGEPTFDV